MKSRNKRIAIVGAGGNIGSQLVPHLARIRGVCAVALIDRDQYEPKNISTQNIAARDVGRAKAAVQGRVLERIQPALRVASWVETVENLPLGRMRADVIVACLDSRQARRTVNRMAWRLGIPWIDAGVRADGLLARVTVYRPARSGTACLECAWDQRDYDLMQDEYACSGGWAHAPATNAPAALGALAAALQALELESILTGRWDASTAGYQVVLEARHHHLYRSVLRRQPTCRFDHRIWRIAHWPESPQPLRLADLFRVGEGRQDGDRDPAVIRMEGSAFVTRIACTACGAVREVLVVDGRLPPRWKTCRCGASCGAIAMTDHLAAATLPRQALRRSLSGMGLRTGDVISISRNRRCPRHFEIGEWPGKKGDR